MNAPEYSESQIEVTAREVRAGRLAMSELVIAFLSTMVYVPSSTDPTQGMNPIRSQTDGREYMVVGTSPEAIKRIGSLVKYVVTLTGKQVVLGLTPGVGIRVEMTTGAFEYTPETVADIRARTTSP